MKKLILLLLCISSVCSAQESRDSDLFREILAKDSVLFYIGFNTCNMGAFEQLMSDDFEFYHDKGGFSDGKEFLQNMRNGLCKDPANYQSRRELINKFSEVFPLYKNGQLYGAIQHGVHQFFEKQANRPEQFGSSAKFTHLWLLQNGEWKLSRSLSYHHNPEKYE